MNQQVKNILSQVYELEGLLLLVENHAKDTDSFVFELIRKKGINIHELTQNFSHTIFESTPVEAGTPQLSNDIPKDEQPINDAPKFDESKYEMLGADTNADEEFEDENPEEVYDEVPLQEPETTEAELASEPDEEFQEPADDEEVVEPLTDDEEMVEDDDDDIVDDEVGTEEETPDEELLDETDEEEDSEPVSLNDVLQRDMSKNLKKAFTLNDRFRYRRELFENSEVQMTNTLNLVETMDSFGEAEDYFYNDLEWDKDSPEVHDFMEIIKQHFS